MGGTLLAGEAARNTAMTKTNVTVNRTDEIKRTDEELMGLLADGNERAFNEIFDRYERPIFNFINKHVRDRQSTEDLAQEVFMRVYKSAGRFDTSRKFSSWIYKIALNEVKRHWKRSAARMTYALNDPVFEDGGDAEHQDFVEDERLTPEELTDGALTSRNLRGLIDKLPEKQKTVVILKVYHDMTFEEIADICDCPLSTVLSRMRYAVNKLRRWMGIDDGDN